MPRRPQVLRPAVTSISSQLEGVDVCVIGVGALTFLLALVKFEAAVIAAALVASTPLLQILSRL